MQDTVATEFDWLKEAISDDTPCGPNLEAEDDDSFIDYYFDAEVRLPERYFTPGLKTDSGEGSEDKLFDPKSINLKKEKKSIDDLLKRSRDLRLLGLLARFSILAGRPTGFADAVEGIAILLETYPDDVHPAIGKAVSERRMPLDDLGSKVTVIIPLQYLSLNGMSEITYRQYMVATGKTDAREGEEEITTSQIIDALGETSTKAAVDKVYAALSRAANAFQRIKDICLNHSDAPFTPGFDETVKLISDQMELIIQARPDLVASPEPEAVSQDSTETETDSDKPSKSKTKKASAAASAPIPTRGAAKAALQAIEQYLAANEPSSAAVLLITQARLLIGRPLIEALETLLPEHSKNAIIDFGKETGFALSIERLRSLSSETAGQANNEDGQENVALPKIKTRTDVAVQIGGVEEYYRQHEPTSPVPILLARATAYLDKDFNAIVAELFPISHKQ